ncbi:hypothetical protein OUZ56_028457 [Daphnia magna]|uniref:Uncharacterized protein n=1 Tax=Daphnia magna TaxID=35525 RepID=A0ABR0B3X6_9CRUS|nr:hypothetical protein OUZ56_028457 [Daphnia magna]
MAGIKIGVFCFVCMRAPHIVPSHHKLNFITFATAGTDKTIDSTPMRFSPLLIPNASQMVILNLIYSNGIFL